MARTNVWLNGARGQVAGMTVYQSGGSTIIREARSAVSNPKTFAQMVQRVIAKTAMNQYSALQDIANHSFQGKSTGKQCMARFLSRNMNYFRERAAQIQQAGGSIYDFYQFSFKGEVKYTPAAVILSEGKLPRVITNILLGGSKASVNVSGNTYGDIINTLNLKRGDQLTFVTVEKDTVTGDFVPRFSRVILDPRETNGSAAPLTTTFVGGNGAVQKPNYRNTGTFASLSISNDKLLFKLSDGLIAAAGVIASRKNKQTWMRSYCKLVLNESVLGADRLSLGDAVDASLATNTIYSDDDLYLNNAGTGGPQGVVTNEQTITGLEVNEYVLLNGISQNVSGGDVYLSASLQSIEVQGRGINYDSITLEQQGSTQEPYEITGAADGLSASWQGNIAISSAQQVWSVKIDGVDWFNIIILPEHSGPVA